MKNNIKKIITEAVLGFLNEAKKDRKRIPVFGQDPKVSVNVPIKVKKTNPIPKIHSVYKKQSTQLSAPGLNEEELPDSDSLFDENTKKKFLKAIQTKDR